MKTARYVILIAAAAAGLYFLVQYVNLPPARDARLAVTEGTLAEVRRAIASGIDLKSKDAAGWTLLMYAANTGVSENKLALTQATDNPEAAAIVAELIRAGAEVDAKDNDGRTALMIAVKDDNVNVVRELLKAGANVNSVANDGRSPLIFAASFAVNLEIFSILLAANANINVKDYNGDSVLIEAARRVDNPKIFAKLLATGADVNAKNNDGETALMWAAYAYKSPKIIDILIKAGADVNAKDNDGYGVLWYAREHPEAQEQLRKAGAKE